MTVMAGTIGDSKYEVGNTVYVPYEGGTHYQARVRHNSKRIKAILCCLY
jgi:hypothetical protein